MVAGVELVSDKRTREPFPASHQMGVKLRAEGIRRGIILRAMGDTLGFSPPLILTSTEVEFLLDRFCESLDALWKSVSKSNSPPV